MKRVVIVGGGITGLAAAYRLAARGRGRIQYTAVESAPRFGGKIVSSREGGFIVEGGPDSFLTQKPAALELCHELGLGGDLIGTNEVARQVYVWSRGQLLKMPEGLMLIIPTRLMPFVRSSLISWPGKLRMGLDAVIPARRDDGDESLAHFVRRRLGPEALDKLAEPMIAGIYVADAESLSLKSTFPRFLEMERQYGSLLRGVLAQRRAASRPHGNNGNNGNGRGPRRAPAMFMTLRGGLAQLTEALVAQLDPAALLAGRRVVALSRVGQEYELTLDDGTKLRADDVILATPAFVTARLVRGLSPELADGLERIRYVSTATVSLGYRRDELSHPLNGFGFVVPRSERRKILACTWSSTKFDGRAPAGNVLLRCFIGGAHAEGLVEQDDRALAGMGRDELRAMMGIRAEPVLTQVYRWRKANPQYEVGHRERVAELEALAGRQMGLHLAGAAYHGVGIPDCIQDADRVVQSILSEMRE